MSIIIRAGFDISTTGGGYCYGCGYSHWNCGCRAEREFHDTVTNFTSALREFVDAAFAVPEGRHSRRWQRTARWRACRFGVPLYRGLEPPREPGAPDADAQPLPRRCSTIVRAAPRGRHHSPIWGQ